MPELRPQQEAALPHLVHVPRAALWLGMGGGKTLTELVAYDINRTAGLVQRELVIGPLRVARDVWPSAANEFMPHLDIEFVGGELQVRERNLRGRQCIHTINFEMVPWLVEQFKGKPWPYDSIVVDEASKLRGFRGSIQIHPKSGKKFLRRGGTTRSGELATVAFKARRFIELTGTPAPKGLINLWPQLWFIDQGARLGRTFEGFKNRWFKPTKDGYGVEPLPHAEREINERIADVCMSIDMKQYMDIKEPIITDVVVDLPSKARDIYREMERDFFAEIEGHEVEAATSAIKSLKCLQIANGAAYTDDAGSWSWVHDAKIEALESIIEEANGMPVLVVYQFVSDVARLKKAFPGARMLKTKKDEDDWNAGRIPILLLHPASGGHGLNLQHGSNIMALFGLTWDLELYQQVIERIGPARQAQSGYDRAVYIYRILAGGTLDTKAVRTRLDTRCSVQDALLAAMRRT